MDAALSHFYNADGWDIPGSELIDAVGGTSFDYTPANVIKLGDGFGFNGNGVESYILNDSDASVSGEFASIGANDSMITVLCGRVTDHSIEASSIFRLGQEDSSFIRVRISDFDGGSGKQPGEIVGAGTGWGAHIFGDDEIVRNPECTVFDRLEDGLTALYIDRETGLAGLFQYSYTLERDRVNVGELSPLDVSDLGVITLLNDSKSETVTTNSLQNTIYGAGLYVFNNAGLPDSWRARVTSICREWRDGNFV